MQLRPYQQASIDAAYTYLRSHDDNPCIVIPTGGGKTPVLATICKDAVSRWDGRVIILAHVKELVEQAAHKLRAICPDISVGIYSASLKRRETDKAITVAQIQSVAKRAFEFGQFHLILVDEAHMIPPDGEGRYRQFLADAKGANPRCRVVGLTATPYRTSTGTICNGDHILNDVCYEVGVKELINDGYLCPLTTKAGAVKADLSGVKKNRGDFVQSSLEGVMLEDAIVEEAVREMLQLTADRKSVLIFAAGVLHGQKIAELVQGIGGQECGFICGESLPAERDELIARFKDETDGLLQREPLKFLCNVNVLTTGFDAPNVDCVVLLRPTLSPGLYYQMVGRGFRLCDGKTNCLILDYGGNIVRHGPVDAIEVNSAAKGDGEAPAKECPECAAVIAAGYSACPECGYEFPPPEDKEPHERQAAKFGVTTDEFFDETYEVHDIAYTVHKKRDWEEGMPMTMRVEYRVGLAKWISEWVCVEHAGYPRQKAEWWWQARCHGADCPRDAEEAVALANNGFLATCDEITVREIAGRPFPQVIGYQLGQVPEVEGLEVSVGMEDVPF